MSLKEFIDNDGVVILHTPNDLQEVVEKCKSMSLKVAEHYTLLGKFPFFFWVKEGRVLVQEEVDSMNMERIIEPGDFLKLCDLVQEEIKNNKGETVFVVCRSENEYLDCLSYFNKLTGQNSKKQDFGVLGFIYFNLQNGFLYPDYVVPDSGKIISYKNFKQRFLKPTEKKDQTLRDMISQIYKVIETQTKILIDLKEQLRELEEGHV